MNIVSTSAAFINNHSRRRARFVFILLLLACAHARGQTTTDTKPTPAVTPSPAVEKNNGAAVGAKTGAIRGRVVGEGGEPLAYAALYLRGSSWGASAPRQFTPVTSDEDGRFVFAELDPGLYKFSVYLPGYALESDADGASTSPGVYRVGDDVTVRMVRGGVITGAVTNADGEPVVAATVRVLRVRTLEGRAAAPVSLWLGNDTQTDDRGVYRLYGLPAGVYLVAAGGGQRWGWAPPTPYDDHAPTYFRSASSVEGAEEVTVRAGQEVGGIDLRYRGERGRAVGGAVVPPAGRKPGASVGVSLTHASTGASAVSASNLAQDGAGVYGFSLEGVADGDYDLRAVSYTNEGEAAASAPLRVSVRGADVSGLRLTLAPLGSVAGDLALEPLRGEPAEACKSTTRRALLAQEVLLAARRLDRPAQTRRPDDARPRETAPGHAGSFQFRALEQGRYRIEARPADEGWYVRDLQLPPQTNATAAKASPAPDALDLKPGQQLGGLRITVAEGAATLSGRLAPRDENAPIPSSPQLRVHLVPAAREQSDNPLRFHEATPAPDGSFNFKHVAPGRYLLLAREVEADSPARPAAWDSATRTRLRREAEAAALPVELQPCQRRADFEARAPRD